MFARFCIHFLLLCLVLVVKAPKPWGDVQQLSPDKIPEGALDARRSAVKEKIVKYHNFFRSKVRPTASNMLKMSWHELAAKQAQEYAERCVYLKHNPGEERTVPRLGKCGQNIFVSSDKSTWFQAIKSWYLEYKNFTYGVPVKNLLAVGHYTQMVWATSYRVGCGVAKCSGGPWGNYYNYICHYCPGGNYGDTVHFPYKKGAPCADCPGHCVSGNLCSNSCPDTDVFANCGELVGVVGFCGKGTCNATCNCRDKLFRNHPWV